MPAVIRRQGSVVRVVRIMVWSLFIGLLPVLLLCFSLVIQSARNPERLPAVFGYKVLILTPTEKNASRSLGIIRERDPALLRQQDPLVYKENGAYYIEPVSRIDSSSERLSIQTESPSDERTVLTPVNLHQVEGVLLHSIPGFGSGALFLQTPAGILLFIALPCLLLVLLNPGRGKIPDDTKERRGRLLPEYK